MGMVGGGRGAFIGQVHRMAANLDGKIELVAGAFSSDPEKSKLSGQDFFVDPDRAYGSYEEMAKAEAAVKMESISYPLSSRTISILRSQSVSLKREST